MKKILIIEDDINILKTLVSQLKDNLWEITTAQSIEEGCMKINKEKPDLIITDLLVSDSSGLNLCSEIKNQRIKIPVLMLTSKVKKIDEMFGLQIDSDNYKSEQFDLNNLSEKVDTLFKKEGKTEVEKINDYSFENIQLDFQNYEAIKNGASIDLSKKEYKILQYLIEHSGEAISRDQLLDDVWGYDAFPSTQTVEQYVLSLRKKLETDPSNPRHLVSVHDTCYKFID